MTTPVRTLECCCKNANLAILPQQTMRIILLCHFLMAYAFKVTADNTSPPLASINPNADRFHQIKLAQERSENEMPDKEPIELPVSRFAEPECVYEVHMDSPDGPLVDRKITIGEMLYHKWECGYNKQQNLDISPNKSSSANSLYCMMVHGCTISSVNQRNSNRRKRRRRRNAMGMALEIVDEFGCAIYTNITPEIEYHGDLSAVLGVQTFALDYDQPAVFFKCNVRLLLKINGRCRRPNCAKK
uniref:ZP domain-containing protein n=1 Tax=Globodera pallida TaxID=36090 RepID=A0A183BMT7_GLOPA